MNTRWKEKSEKDVVARMCVGSAIEGQFLACGLVLCGPGKGFPKGKEAHRAGSTPHISPALVGLGCCCWKDRKSEARDLARDTVMQVV